MDADYLRAMVLSTIESVVQNIIEKSLAEIRDGDDGFSDLQTKYILTNEGEKLHVFSLVLITADEERRNRVAEAINKLTADGASREANFVGPPRATVFAVGKSKGDLDP